MHKSSPYIVTSGVTCPTQKSLSSLTTFYSVTCSYCVGKLYYTISSGDYNDTTISVTGGSCSVVGNSAAASFSEFNPTY